MLKTKLLYATFGHIFLILNLYALSKNNPQMGLVSGIIATFWYIRSLFTKIK